MTPTAFVPADRIASALTERPLSMDGLLTLTEEPSRAVPWIEVSPAMFAYNATDTESPSRAKAATERDEHSCKAPRTDTELLTASSAVNDTLPLTAREVCRETDEPIRPAPRDDIPLPKLRESVIDTADPHLTTAPADIDSPSDAVPVTDIPDPNDVAFVTVSWSCNSVPALMETQLVRAVAPATERPRLTANESCTLAVEPNRQVPATDRSDAILAGEQMTAVPFNAVDPETLSESPRTA